jgi:sodium/potassium/calcium exchanger 2
VDEKATQLHAIASLKVLLDATKPHNGAATTSAANHVSVAQRLENEKNQETQLAAMQEQPNGVASGLEDSAAVDTVSINNRVTIENWPKTSISDSRNY